MATNERDEQVEALEVELGKFQTSYDENTISKQDFTREMSKLSFRIEQLRESNPRGQKQERSHERCRDFFND